MICNVPPFKVILVASKDPGTVPNVLSELIFNVPLPASIPPVSELLPLKVSSPVPSIKIEPSPLTIPDKVRLLEDENLRVAKFAIEIFPE